MASEDNHKNHVFPRIPLKLEIPGDYPDIGRILNISVIAEIKEYRITRHEMEISGSYRITVSYFKTPCPPDEGPRELRELECDDFFSHLRIQADGLFTDNQEEPQGTAGSPELYTVHFARPFHTFVDTQFIGRVRQFKPGMTVVKADLNRKSERLVGGELVLGLVNRTRRRLW